MSNLSHAQACSPRILVQNTQAKRSNQTIKKPTAYVSRSGHKLSLNCDDASHFLHLIAQFSGFYLAPKELPPPPPPEKPPPENPPPLPPPNERDADLNDAAPARIA